MNRELRKETISLDEQKAEGEIRTYRQVVKALYENTNSSIFIISTDYKLTFFNKRAADVCRLFYGKDLCLGESVLCGENPHSEEVYSALKRNIELALNGTSTVSERELKYQTYATWVRAEYAPVYEEQRIVAVCLRIKEINDRKEFEGEIEKKNNSLKEIAWIQSHETRQPVATILGLINIIDKKTLSDDNLEIISLLEKTVVKLDQVIRDTIIKANSMGR